MNPQLYESPVTCLEGDRPNEERIQATGKHVAVLLPTTTDGIYLLSTSSSNDENFEANDKDFAHVQSFFAEIESYIDIMKVGLYR